MGGLHQVCRDGSVFPAFVKSHGLQACTLVHNLEDTQTSLSVSACRQAWNAHYSLQFRACLFYLVAMLDHTLMYAVQLLTVKQVLNMQHTALCSQQRHKQILNKGHTVLCSQQQ